MLVSPAMEKAGFARVATRFDLDKQAESYESAGL